MPRIPSDFITNFSYRETPDGTFEIILDYYDGVKITTRLTNTVFERDFRSFMNNPEQLVDQLQRYMEITGTIPHFDLSHINGESAEDIVERYGLNSHEVRRGVDLGRNTDVVGYAVGTIAAGDMVVVNDLAVGRTRHIEDLHNAMRLHLAQVEGLVYGESALSPKIKYPEMDCAACNCKLDQPENIGNLLTQEEVDNYIKVCAELKQKPQLYCCNCFEVVKRTPKMLSVWTQLIRQYRNFVKRAEDLDERSNMLNKHQKRIDENIEDCNRMLEEIKHQREQLKRNPFRLILAEICKERQPKVKAVTSFSEHELERIGLPYMMEAEKTRKFGHVLISQPESATFRFGYQRLYFVIVPMAGVSGYSVSIPIPFMKKSHGVQYLMFCKLFKKWRIF